MFPHERNILGPSKRNRICPRGASSASILGFILTLTPLGVLAVGSAWGEWRMKDLSDSAARRQIEAASNNQPLPPNLPRGLEGSASLWKAPISDYAPSFIRNRYFGYVA